MTKLKVLLVEDSSTYRRIIVALGQEKADFITCENLSEAAEAIKQGEFDIVLLDLYLPDGNSIEFCRQFTGQSKSSDSIVVFLSSEMDLEWRLRAYEAGAEDFILKNLRTEELGLKMDSLFNYQAKRLEALLELKKQAENLITENYNVQIDNNAILAFYKDCVKIRSLDQIKVSLLSVFLNWQLNYIARITLADGSTIYFKNQDDIVGEMEKELFSELSDNNSNVQSFGTSSFFKSGNVELIIKNMPIENEGNYSRLIDLFHMLTDVIHSRWDEIEHINKIEKIADDMQQFSGESENMTLVGLIRDLDLEVKALKKKDVEVADATNAELTFF